MNKEKEIVSLEQLHLQKIQKIIKEKCKILNEAAKSDETKQVLIEICKKDPIYFFTYFLVTDRNPGLIPEQYGNEIPFILFEFQEEFIKDAWDCILMGRLPPEERTEPTDMFSEKSRQMGFSWLFAGLQLYAYIFHDMKSLYISMKADEVDRAGDIKSHFEKIRFMIRNLPQWILPKGLNKESGTEHNKSMVISRGDGTGVIKGESANPNAGRGGTTAFTIFDEMAFMQYAQAINMAIASSTPCRFFNSTPNGEGNEYYRMRKLAVDGKIRYHSCMRYENPFYTKEWYKWRTESMTKTQIAQEILIDYNTALVGRVYPEYKHGTELIEYDDSLPLYIGIDNSHGGQDNNALVVLQKDGHYFNIIDSCEFNCSPRQMAEIMAKQPTIQMSKKQLDFYNKYREMKLPIFVSDCYDTHTSVGDNTIFGYYQDVGIFLNIPSTRKKQEQIQIVSSNLHRVRVSETCADFSSCIQNSIYPEIKENSMRTTPATLPVHSWASHIRTSFEYLIVWLIEQEKYTNVKPKRIATEERNPITGEVETKYVYI